MLTYVTLPILQMRIMCARKLSTVVRDSLRFQGKEKSKSKGNTFSHLDLVFGLDLVNCGDLALCYTHR